jgi:hypothetical protein
MKKGPEHEKTDNTNCPVGIKSNRKVRPSQQNERKREEGKWGNRVIIFG